MTIIIGADFVPTKSNVQHFISGDISQLFDEGIISELKKADFRIFNLEIPLTDTESPIKKNGPTLIAPTGSINAYINTKVDLLTLANNHILDQGKQGLESTIKVLNNNNIEWVGVGDNICSLTKYKIIIHKQKRIGVYACAEHEFSIATNTSAGANPFEPLDTPDEITKLKAICDYVIVLYHGGKEHYRYPSPYLQKVCRKMIDKGADLIVCQHSHCIGCEEKYKNSTIVYGQGNFLFDYCDNDFWANSLLIKIDDNYNISYIPLIKNGAKVRIADEKEKNYILDLYKKRTDSIKEEGFIENKYNEFVSENINNYLAKLSGKLPLWFKIINKLLRHKLYPLYSNIKFPLKKRLVLLNYLVCEPHKELLVNGLTQKNNE